MEKSKIVTGFRSSHGCGWNNPRPYTDESQRRQKHGKILPMEEPKRSLWGWLLGK